MVVIRSLKDVMTLSVFKLRHDNYTDQFSRIFMTKILLIASIIMGVDYFSDQVNCMISNDASHSKDFFHAACWISGFYIFDEMRMRLDQSGYYGIPQRVDYDGIDVNTNKLCHTKDIFGVVPDCAPMTRIYYLQYQWMPVYVASIGIFFYVPYILFRITNNDVICLKKEIKKVSATDTSPIMHNYFNYAVNTICHLRTRVLWNFVVKLLYVFMGVSGLYITDHVLMGKYLTYGKDYLDWYEQNNTLRHITVTKSLRAHAGNALLPSMGYCDIHEASLETRVAFHNENRFICEISPHILYQYVFMVLWFFFISNIAISLIGLLLFLLNTLSHIVLFGRHPTEKLILKMLTVREKEYLDIIKKTSLVKYGDILTRLKHQRYNIIGDADDGGINFQKDLDGFMAARFSI